MTKTKITIKEFIKSTRPMVGLELSHAWRGHGSAIFLEIGTLTQDAKRNHPQGEFSIMLDCSWRIEKSRSILVGSLATHARIEEQLNKLIGSRVKEIGLFSALPEIMISFDSNIRFLSFEAYEAHPAWGLRLPDGLWLGSCNGELTKEIAEHRSAQERWKIAASCETGR
jgi:hypothetical protein